MGTRLVVGTISSLEDAIWSLVWSEAPPTELVLTTTRHVIAATLLFHAVVAVGASTEPLGVLKQL